MRKIAKVYLVDDSEIDNYFHKMVCEKSGVVEQLQSFTCAAQALAHFNVCPVKAGEFIFLDISMPRMTGFEFLEALNGHEAVQGMTPFVIVVSTSNNPADSIRAKESSIVHDYLGKALSTAYLTALSERSGEKASDLNPG